MSDYNQIRTQVLSLTPEEQLRLIDEVLSMVRRRVVAKPNKHSLLELRGLGKEIWEGIDAQEYVNQERGQWNG
ncbi:hypothetical protein [[Phormidium] sp. ETS-05]|uniref:hypothetical protein n=1 Tax=[Phormidium] sp. ETS-05 TaxID=222819 RepID=UPI0018EF1DFB|nr:hypothetical protein [[Phormidium] sp. ETS-05]